MTRGGEKWRSEGMEKVGEDREEWRDGGSRGGLERWR